MIVRKAELFATAVGPAQYPAEGKPEIALAGRSNVGKSSLINALLGRKNLARTSGTPGKTRTLNFYAVNEAWFIVDLPGYGYAKVSREDRARWGRFIDAYLHKRQALAGIIHLVDMRHPPMESDKTMARWLLHDYIPLLVVGTKADKLPRGRWSGRLREIRQELSLPEAAPVIAFSSLNGLGREEVEKWLEERLEGKQ